MIFWPKSSGRIEPWAIWKRYLGVLGNSELPRCGRVETSKQSIISYRRLIQSQAINAFSLPHGVIAVTSGSDGLSSDEVATILGHEVIHVVYAHHIEGLGLNLILLLFQYPLIMLLYAVCGKQISTRVIHFLLTSLCKLYSLSKGRSMETEADFLGMFMASRACYNVAVMPSFWSRLAAFYPDRTALPGWVTLLFRDHPSIHSRCKLSLQNLAHFMAERGRAGCPQLPEKLQASCSYPRLFNRSLSVFLLNLFSESFFYLLFLIQSMFL